MRSWTSRSFDRRAVLGGLAGALAVAAAGPALAQQRGVYGRLVIDTGPLADTGAGELAANVRPLIARSVNAALAGRIGVRGAPTLTITVRALTLAMYGGLGGGRDRDMPFGMNDTSPLDYLDTIITVSNGRQILESFPLLVNSSASWGGPVVDPRSEWRRVQHLCDTLAYWLAKKVS